MYLLNTHTYTYLDSRMYIVHIQICFVHDLIFRDKIESQKSKSHIPWHQFHLWVGILHKYRIQFV